MNMNEPSIRHHLNLVLEKRFVAISEVIQPADAETLSVGVPHWYRPYDASVSGCLPPLGMLVEV